jgi:hypothetical protein
MESTNDHTACLVEEKTNTWICRSGFMNFLNAAKFILEMKSRDNDINGIIMNTKDYKTLLSDHIENKLPICLIIPEDRKKTVNETLLNVVTGKL